MSRCRVPILSDWKFLVETVDRDDAAERHGEAGLTNLVLTLRAAAHKGCGGSLVANRQDARCARRYPALKHVSPLAIVMIASATARRTDQSGAHPASCCAQGLRRQPQCEPPGCTVRSTFTT